MNHNLLDKIRWILLIEDIVQGVFESFEHFKRLSLWRSETSFPQTPDVAFDGVPYAFSYNALI
jgi:hypothetical protein